MELLMVARTAAGAVVPQLRVALWCCGFAAPLSSTTGELVFVLSLSEVVVVLCVSFLLRSGVYGLGYAA